MPDDNQILIPPSFIALFIAPGRQRPSEPRDVIAARHELCEDMAQMLTEHPAIQHADLGARRADVLGRMHQGLLAEGAGFAAAEAGWVIGRLAELLDWPVPPDCLPAGALPPGSRPPGR